MKTFDSSNRITYAQKKLLALLEARQLRSWCPERNLPHASLYKLAVGQSVPTFKPISYLVPYFAPAEWLFFTDEEIPYTIRTLPEWNPDNTSIFIQQHKKDWKQTVRSTGLKKKMSGIFLWTGGQISRFCRCGEWWGSEPRGEVFILILLFVLWEIFI